MIIKASQRGNGAELARHLLNGHDNEHVEVHEISGYLDDSVKGALHEAQAISQGTCCTKYLFSVSFSPPLSENVSIAAFEDAITRVEQEMKLEGQPRIIVFHEKEGRRHAHAVWSRIDTNSMTAINLPFFKNRLMGISKELYLKHDWELPKGFINREMRNPLNFTREQWQQAKRLNERPQTIKITLQEAWAVSDSRKAFSRALEDKGYYLAKGDRRGFVAVDWRGETYSLSRWLGVKSKTLKERLGEPHDLPSVEDSTAQIDHSLTAKLQGFIQDVTKHHEEKLSPLLTRKDQMKERHSKERVALARTQAKRQEQEAQNRQARFRSSIRDLWDRITGNHAQIKKKNEAEAYQAHMRYRAEKETLIHRQLDERLALQDRLEELRMDREADINQLREMVFSKLSDEKIKQFQQAFEQPEYQYHHDYDMGM